jgi:hypothetical protein
MRQYVLTKRRFTFNRPHGVILHTPPLCLSRKMLLYHSGCHNIVCSFRVLLIGLMSRESYTRILQRLQWRVLLLRSASTPLTRKELQAELDTTCGLHGEYVLNARTELRAVGLVYSD